MKDDTKEQTSAKSSQDASTQTQEIPENTWTGPKLTKTGGVADGPSGKETYYNPHKVKGNTSGIQYALELSRQTAPQELLKNLEGEPTIDEQGFYRLNGRLIVAVHTSDGKNTIYPKGTIIQTTNGEAVVVDGNPGDSIDVAVSW